MSLDLTTASTTAPVTTAPPARSAEGGHARSAATRRATLAATRRDLDRLTRVLAQPITATRRTALVGHVGYLVDQIRGADPELADRYAGPLSRLRHESRRWSREPGRRLALLAATEHATSAVGPAVAADRDTPPLDGLAAGAGSNRTSLLDLSAQRPTTLAYRYFWLLDDLPAHAAEPLTREFTAPARWVLRNVLSGGYNRRAHLMWIGGGAGPAI